MLFNVTCRELAHQMGWSSSFSICCVCWGLGSALLLWGATAQAAGAAAMPHEWAGNSSAFTCCHKKRIVKESGFFPVLYIILAEAPPQTGDLPSLEEALSWFLSLLIPVCGERTTGGTGWWCWSAWEGLSCESSCGRQKQSRGPAWALGSPALRTASCYR